VGYLAHDEPDEPLTNYTSYLAPLAWFLRDFGDLDHSECGQRSENLVASSALSHLISIAECGACGARKTLDC
jgi:hypothetical protein